MGVVSQQDDTFTLTLQRIDTGGYVWNVEAIFFSKAEIPQSVNANWPIRPVAPRPGKAENS